MIEKVKAYEETPSGYKHPENLLQDKINELVDTVNRLQLTKDVMFGRIDMLNDTVNELQKHEEQHLDLLTELNEIRLHQNKAPAETPTISKMENVNFGTGRRIDISYINDIDNDTDPYAEQRRWIGKLCWFWDNQEEYKFVGILWEIADNGTYFQKGGIVSYLNCEPVKPDDDIIYKGGNNE